MNNKFRATMALALSLIGVSSVAATAPAPEVKDEKAPTFPKRPGQEAPAPRKFGGGGPTNHNADGPACPGGPCYRKVVDPDSGVPGWRAFQLSLYYRGLPKVSLGEDGVTKVEPGDIHGYQPGADKGRDMAFPAIARKQGLVLMGRKERRALHREERKRYAAIVKARKNAPTEA